MTVLVLNILQYTDFSAILNGTPAFPVLPRYPGETKTVVTSGALMELAATLQLGGLTHGENLGENDLHMAMVVLHIQLIVYQRVKKMLFNL